MRFIQMACSMAAGFFMVVLAVSGASAAQLSECKGLEQQKCLSETRCSWVRSYTTRRGTKVKAFCRRKPGRKQTTQAVPDQPNGT